MPRHGRKPVRRPMRPSGLRDGTSDDFAWEAAEKLISSLDYWAEVF